MPLPALVRTPPALRAGALLTVVGFILHLNSERAYWFYSTAWFGSHLVDTLTTTAFYAIAAGLALWGLARTAYRGWHQVVLAGAVFAWTIEGAVVHVLHEAGPLDVIFPAMFAGWHGLLSFTGLFFLVRKLLIGRRSALLAACSAGYGLVVGSWAITSWLPDADSVGNLVHPEVAAVAEPEAFAATMLLVVGSLALAHLILDRVWDPHWRPGRAFTWTAFAGTALLAGLGFFTVPYGPIRYAILVSIPLGALLASGRRAEGPTLFDALTGRIRTWHLLALTPAAITAAGVYSLAWDAGFDQTTLEAVRELHVFGQLLIGGGVLVWALLRAMRNRNQPSVRIDAQPASVSGAG